MTLIILKNRISIIHTRGNLCECPVSTHIICYQYAIFLFISVNIRSYLMSIGNRNSLFFPFNLYNMDNCSKYNQQYGYNHYKK